MNLNFADFIIKVKEKALIDLERAKKGLETTVGAKYQMRLRNEAIHNAWMYLDADPPWSTKKFINELSGYSDNALFDQIEKSYIIYFLFTHRNSKFMTVLI